MLSLLTAGAPAVFANDSTITLGAGGLKFEKNDQISMLSEKLFLSPSRVAVDYEMKNQGQQAAEISVGFPLPLLNAAELVNVPVQTDFEHPDNFVQFQVTVDGRKVEPSQEVRAFEIEGKKRDVTELLRGAGLLVSPVAKNFYEQLEKLPELQRRKLEDEKLLVVDRFSDGSTSFTPTWEVQITYHWRQHYDPGAVVRVHHEYTPVVGRGFFGSFSFDDEAKEWCIDEGTKKGIQSLLRTQKSTEGVDPLLERKQVDYVLKTTANWAGPIGSFELTVEKQYAGQIISTCFHGLQKIALTQFHFVKKNYRPAEDLSFIFLGPLGTVPEDSVQ